MTANKKLLVLVNFFLIFTKTYSFTSNMGYSKSVDKVITKVEKLTTGLNKVLDFINRYYYEMNLDGALGLILTEVQLLQCVENVVNQDMTSLLLTLIEKCQISRQIIQLLPKRPRKNILFVHFLLNPLLWETSNNFVSGKLKDLGIYESWTAHDILQNRTAQYGGVPSDECLREILEETPADLQLHICTASTKCELFMFGERNDTGYALTHRLLYLYVIRMVGCVVNEATISSTIQDYCSLILKEAKTNAFLGFPQHDIFLEQMVLCGMEGFAEFFQEEWTSSILEWQTLEGCFEENATFVNANKIHNKITSRSANVIAFGCTDHATGLGAAALALNLRYTLQNLQKINN